MDTPHRTGFGLWIAALAFALATTLACAEPAPLALEAQVNGVWTRVLRIERRHVIGEGAAGAVEIPATAPLRLTGDPAENTEAFDSATTFDLLAFPAPSGSGKPPRWKARAIRLCAKTLIGPRGRWQPANPEQAILVCVWPTATGPAIVRGFPLQNHGNGEFAFDGFSLDLDPAAVAGNPCFLLFENGRPLPSQVAPEQREGVRLGTLAALGRDAEVAAALRQAGAIPATPKDEPNLLHRCAQAGAADSVATLLTLGASTKTRTTNDDSALHLAARCHRAAVVTKLLAGGASTESTNNEENTPLHLAATNCAPEVCRLLIEAKASLSAYNRYRQPPALLAAISGCTPAVELMVAHGGKFDFAANGENRTLVAQAALGQRELVGILLAQKAKPDFFWREQSPLLGAAREGHAEIIGDLLAAKADPNLANKDGVTPLLAAASRGHAAATGLLLAAGARPEGSRARGVVTPLVAACYAGSPQTVKALLAAGADPAAEFPWHGAMYRPLSIAVCSGSPETVGLLLAAGARANPASPLFDADLTQALAMDADTFVAAALREGMAPDFHTAAGWSALQIASLSRAERSAALLKAAGAIESPQANGPQIVPSAQLEKKPALVELCPVIDPRDPEESDFREEVVVVDAVIGSDGRPAFARASCQDCRLSQSAVRTVLNSRFAPALKSGVAVPSLVRIPVQFCDSSEVTFDTNRVDVRASPLSQPAPRYPDELKRKGVNGSATVWFVVAADGSIRDVKVVNTTHPAFGASCIAAVKQWRFKPAMIDGRPVACRMQQAFPFMVR